MARVNRLASIRIKMLFYSLSVIIFMTTLSLYAISIMTRYEGQIEAMFEKHLYLSQIEEMMIKLDSNLLDFLSTKSSTKLNDYLIGIDNLNSISKDKAQTIYNMEDVMMKNIVYLIDAYEEKADTAIAYKRQRNVYQYYNYYEESKTIKGFILDYIQELNTRQLNRNSKSYTQLLSQIQLLQRVTIVIIMMLIILSLLIVSLITSKMVKPIKRLSHAAEEIAKGNLKTEDVVVDTEDEWLLLANTFNKMKNSISNYIEELHKKAEMENRLKDEQLKNVRMEHLLDNARLYALQSQINPHFLFNTINAGVQLSAMERAPKTGQFLDTMSSLFRYNIQNMDSVVTIGDEVNNIRDYYELLKVRFGDRIQFDFDIDEEVMSVKIPPLILQPLVENAFIHGLSGLEEGGRIVLRSYQEKGCTFITVSDTGKGMTEETVAGLLSREEYVKVKDEKAGIGVKNVRDRLELFFHKTDIFRIESQMGQGTRIILELPVMG